MMLEVKKNLSGFFFIFFILSLKVHSAVIYYLPELRFHCELGAESFIVDEYVPLTKKNQSESLESKCFLFFDSHFISLANVKSKVSEIKSITFSVNVLVFIRFPDSDDISVFVVKENNEKLFPPLLYSGEAKPDYEVVNFIMPEQTLEELLKYHDTAGENSQYNVLGIEFERGKEACAIVAGGDGRPQVLYDWDLNRTPELPCFYVLSWNGRDLSLGSYNNYLSIPTVIGQYLKETKLNEPDVLSHVQSHEEDVAFSQELSQKVSLGGAENSDRYDNVKLVKNARDPRLVSQPHSINSCSASLSVADSGRCSSFGSSSFQSALTRDTSESNAASCFSWQSHFSASVGNDDSGCGVVNNPALSAEYTFTDAPQPGMHHIALDNKKCRLHVGSYLAMMLCRYTSDPRQLMAGETKDFWCNTLKTLLWGAVLPEDFPVYVHHRIYNLSDYSNYIHVAALRAVEATFTFYQGVHGGSEVDYLAGDTAKKALYLRDKLHSNEPVYNHGRADSLRGSSQMRFLHRATGFYDPLCQNPESEFQFCSERVQTREYHKQRVVDYISAHLPWFYIDQFLSEMKDFNEIPPSSDDVLKKHLYQSFGGNYCLEMKRRSLYRLIEVVTMKAQSIGIVPPDWLLDALWLMMQRDMLYMGHDVANNRIMKSDNYLEVLGETFTKITDAALRVNNEKLDVKQKFSMSATDIENYAGLVDGIHSIYLWYGDVCGKNYTVKKTDRDALSKLIKKYKPVKDKKKLLKFKEKEWLDVQNDLKMMRKLALSEIPLYTIGRFMEAAEALFSVDD